MDFVAYRLVACLNSSTYRRSHQLRACLGTIFFDREYAMEEENPGLIDMFSKTQKQFRRLQFSLCVPLRARPLHHKATALLAAQRPRGHPARTAVIQVHPSCVPTYFYRLSNPCAKKMCSPHYRATKCNARSRERPRIGKPWDLWHADTFQTTNSSAGFIFEICASVRMTCPPRV